MSEPKPNLTRSLEYFTEYADGAILQIGDKVSKLIFYEYETLPNEDSTDFDHSKKPKLLKFEIRIPIDKIENLAENTIRLMDLQYTIHKITGKAKKYDGEEIAINTWWMTQKKIEESTYDTEEYYLVDKELHALEQKLFELTGKPVKHKGRYDNIILGGDTSLEDNDRELTSEDNTMEAVK